MAYGIMEAMDHLSLSLTIAVLIAWFYAYFKTKERGFLLIALAGLVGVLVWIVEALTLALTGYDVRRTFDIIKIESFLAHLISTILIVGGVIHLIRRFPPSTP